MNSESASPMTAGLAFRVTLTCVAPPEAYQGVYVRMDERSGVVHIFAADMRTHFLTIPLSGVIVEWRDPAELKPQPRTAPYGPSSFEELGAHLQKMTEALGQGFGPS